MTGRGGVVIRSLVKKPESRSRETPHAPPVTPVAVDDVEDLLDVANDERHMVWFWREGGGRWGFLEGRTPLSLRELGIREATRQRFGGGAFRARLRERGGKWGVSREFAIEGERKTAPAEASDASSRSGESTPAPASSPDWVRSIVMPIAATLGTALAAGIAKRLLETPQADPLLVKLLERLGRGAGDGLDPLELQRLVLDAEKRGEDRGRELGELAAGVGAAGKGSGGDSVVKAVTAALPTINRMLDQASGQRRRQLAPPVMVTEPLSSSISPPESPVPDIVPTWLRPFIGYKGLFLDAADRGKDATQYASLVMDRVEDDEQLLTAVVEANGAARLLADLEAAIPELGGTETRKQFAAAFVDEIRQSLEELTVDDTTPTEGKANA